MRPQWILALFLLLALGLAGITFVSSTLIEEHSRPVNSDKAAKAPAPVLAAEDGVKPVAVVDKTEHNFGAMGQHAIGHHSFKIRNEGEAPLILQKGETSCKCTLSDLAQNSIEPGSEGQVQLEWKTLLIQGEFRQTAEILTNDPKHSRIVFTVVGTVHSPVRITPQEFGFTNLHASEGGSAEVQVFATASDNLKLGPVTFQYPDTASIFDVSTSQIAANDLPPDAKSGWTVKATLKPGLPLGRIQQTIRLETNLSEVKQLEIPVQGTVQGHFKIYGKDWNDDLRILKLGVIPSREGAERNLKLNIKGPKRNELRFSPPVCDPNLIEVTVGEAKDLDDTSLVQIPLTVRIPRGLPTMNHLGSDRQGRMGEVKIETSDADYGSVVFKVQFAIEE